MHAEEAEEVGETFMENALLKARNAAVHCGHACALADDSGLVVPALNGCAGNPFGPLRRPARCRRPGQ